MRLTLKIGIFFKNHVDNANLNENYLFYMGKGTAKPTKATIDTILDEWSGKYVKLEAEHNYIQWLFPNREQGVNMHAQPLQVHEIQVWAYKENFPF
jgi:hypothetical protein